MNEPEDGIEVTCFCTYRFIAPRSLKGGLANCPSCGKAAEVPGGPEPLFWLLLGVGMTMVLGLSAAIWAVAGPWGGIITLGAGGLILGIVVAAS